MTLKKGLDFNELLNVMKVYLEIFRLFLNSELYSRPELRVFIFAGDSIEYQYKTHEYERLPLFFMSHLSPILFVNFDLRFSDPFS